MIAGINRESYSTPINNRKDEPQLRTIQSMLLTLIGTVLLASGFAHAWASWPAMSGERAAKSVSEEIGGGLRMGWYFGSVAFFVLSAIVLQQAIRSWTKKSMCLFLVMSIGNGFLVFAGLGMASRGRAVGYEAFGIIGALTIASAAIPVEKPMDQG